MDACNLDTVCLGDFCSCGDITLFIRSIKEGNYTMFAKFNGILLDVDIYSEGGGLITIPNIFNEDYTYTIWFVDESNAILNNTRYSLRILPCQNVQYTPPIMGAQYDDEQYNNSQYY